MCIKIIGTETCEYNQSVPLSDQLGDAKEIHVDYDPSEKDKIDAFVGEMTHMVSFGITCSADIKVNANNYLTGIQIERYIENLKKKLNINQAIKDLTKFHSETDNKLCEISKMCMGEINEC